MSKLHASRARINPAVLRWGIERAHSTPSAVAKATGSKLPIVKRWMTGDASPTFPQAQKASKHLGVPFACLFLPEPPTEDLPIPDFRTLGGIALPKASIDLRHVILATLRRQSWLSDLRKDEGGDPVAVVGRFLPEHPWRSVAKDMQEELDINALARSQVDHFLRRLTARTEALGVCVIRSGVVGNNTHRPLDVKEFRGFALCDPFAPFVFVNSADAKVAQIFTLVHELAHVWLDETGISGPFRPRDSDTETRCNRIAAEVLVPEEALLEAWPGFSDPEIGVAVKRAARRFGVSRFVLAFKAHHSKLIDQEDLDGLLDEYRHDAYEGSGSGSGGDFYATAIVRNSRSFATELVDALDRRRVLAREAAGLLEIRTKHVDRLAGELAANE